MPRRQKKTIERIKEAPKDIYCSRSQVGLPEKDKVNIFSKKHRSAPLEKFTGQISINKGGALLI
jgi:hypothetical protein